MAVFTALRHSGSDLPHRLGVYAQRIRPAVITIRPQELLIWDSYFPLASRIYFPARSIEIHVFLALDVKEQHVAIPNRLQVPPRPRGCESDARLAGKGKEGSRGRWRRGKVRLLTILPNRFPHTS